ncbi:hypothetical protein EDM68_00325 [Candidatus Uhrbacteria bacterium]|nr:MAG: hypothetical protein EDM68_00325 [Candidatus Uhrbacteria bacterium]
MLNDQGKRLLAGFIFERDANITTLVRVAQAIAPPFWRFDTVEMPSNGYIFQRVANLSGEIGLLTFEVMRHIEATSSDDCFEMRLIVDFTRRIVLSDVNRFYGFWCRYPDGDYEPRMTRHQRMRDIVTDGLLRLLSEPSASEGLIRDAITGYPLGWTKQTAEAVLVRFSESPHVSLIKRVLIEVPKKAEIEKSQFYHSYQAD